MDDPEQRHRLGVIGRERASFNLSWDNQAINLLAVCQTVLAP